MHGRRREPMAGIVAREALSRSSAVRILRLWAATGVANIGHGVALTSDPLLAAFSRTIPNHQTIRSASESGSRS